MFFKTSLWVNHLSTILTYIVFYSSLNQSVYRKNIYIRVYIYVCYDRNIFSFISISVYTFYIYILKIYKLIFDLPRPQLLFIRICISSFYLRTKTSMVLFIWVVVLVSSFLKNWQSSKIFFEISIYSTGWTGRFSCLERKKNPLFCYKLKTIDKL